MRRLFFLIGQASWTVLGWSVFTGCSMGGLLGFPSEEMLDRIGSTGLLG